MSMEGFNDSGSVKSKTLFPQKKLLIKERVEVRSFEEGFLGSWHPGTVIQCERRKRHVRYENVLDDDGLNHLVEVVTVSSALDGCFGSSSFRHKRGVIRPLPPLVNFDKCDLKFGLCVDVSYQEAWWEGVIFDRCDGMEERSVFFPDLGDEMKVRVHEIRITQDWDEVTEKWEQRGNWVFLELIEEHERESYIPVSVKQIWYDVRQKNEFSTIGDWTLNVKKDLWRDMIMEVVGDYMTLTIKEVYSALELSELVMESVELKSDADLNTTISEKKNVEQKEPVFPVKKDLPKFQNETTCNGSGEVVLDAICFKKNEHRRTYSWSNHWERLIVSENEYCPDAVKQYVLNTKKRLSTATWTNKVWKHLSYLGWEIDFHVGQYGKRYRYKPPNDQGEKKVYYSLIKLCKDMEMESVVNSFPSKSDHSIMHPTGDCHVPHVPRIPSEKTQNRDVSPLVDCHLPHVPCKPSEKTQNQGVFPLVVPPPSAAVADEQVYCPRAILEYHKRASESNWEKRKCIAKVKKYLLAEGWDLIGPPPDNKRKGIVYISPNKQRFGSLIAACNFCIEESTLKSTISGEQPLNSSALNEENVGQVSCDELYSENRKRKHMKRSNESLLKGKSNELTQRVLRSNKRVRTVSASCLSHQKSLNVMSWLIDCNSVLPRSKVFYRAKRGHRVMAVGRITCEGIKCNCCLRIYGLVGFECHAIGSSTTRPSASIFLEDGRSLLYCQTQIMQDHKSREAMVKPLGGLCQGDNDYVCSVCHYGGELILCDQCPSSFHKTCLGLEDVPDGDWFCPSCCCGICDQSRINGVGEDGHLLTCIQCEHKYHVACLKNRETSNSRRYVESRFCRKDCEKIYAGLQKLLGEPVSVGADNLTWTLVKFIDSQSCDLDTSKSELMAESYSKLNLALSLMHECFEPVKESSSSRDMMEDVIFSRWSELNRTNFQGFYTVLLERNEELVSVATIRVYGDKVAEVPLVGTRVQYRRHGMCHILMDELEKKLMQLGVERLVLPAVPSVVDTWTGSFGFSKMTNFDRSQFLDYTFLDFPGTIMCQKLLTKIPSPDSVLPIEFQQKQDAISGSSSGNFEKSPVSEVYQEGEIDKREILDQQMADKREILDQQMADKREILDQQMVDTVDGDNDNLGSAVIDCVPMVEQPSPEEQQYWQNGTSSQDSFVKWNGLCYYRRRKVKVVDD